MVTSSEDGTVKIWETRTGTIQRSYNHNSPVNDVVIHPNQGEIISCDRSGFVRVWDLAENSCAHHLTPEEDVSVSSVTVGSDGTLLCAANNAVCIAISGIIHSSLTLLIGKCIHMGFPYGIQRHSLGARHTFQCSQGVYHANSTFPRR